MNLYENGLVIQEKVDSEYFLTGPEIIHSPGLEKYRSYKGLARFLSWPLEREKDQESRLLTARAHKNWFDAWYNEREQKYSLNVVPDIEYCLKYLKVCRDKGLYTRIIFCKTERDSPIWNGIVPKEVFLGYDYATSQDFYSTIPDDLLGEVVSPLLCSCRLLLNPNRLFNTESDVLSYVMKRNEAIQSGEQIESFGDFCIYHLSEVEPETVVPRRISNTSMQRR